MALISGRADPMPFWIPGAFGSAAGLIMFVTGRLAGKETSQMAWDEGYVFDTRRAAIIGFWFGLALYPIFGALLAMGMIRFDLAFAVMGLSTGGAYLLPLVWFELRGRADL